MGAGNNKRFDLGTAEALEKDIDIQWKAFMGYHCTSLFFKEVDRLFDLNLEGSIGVRKRDGTDIQLDCQVSINTPVTEESQVCIAHRDNPETKWAGILYMKEKDDDAGGDLLIYDCPEPEWFDKRRVKNHGEPVKVVEYAPNTLFCFKNTENSIHACSARKVTSRTRKLVNFVIDSK